MNATIITIGDELLIGQVIDTNSAFIAQHLNGIGVAVKRRIAVGDEASEIIRALKEACKISEVIIVTGGLGPTKDDITKQTICDFFGSKLVMNEEILQMVVALFEKLNRPMVDINKKQAEVPDNCIPIKNLFGTAPGMWFEKEGKLFAFMPGVPFEMKPMFMEQILPRLRNHFSINDASRKSNFIIHRTIHVHGIGESFLADKIKDIEEKFPEGFKLAYLPNYSIVRLRISATGTDEKLLKKKITELESELNERLGDHIFGYDDTSLEIEIGKLLRAQKKTIATAESMTGGTISKKIAAIPGASDYFKGSVVCYSNDVKQRVLEVKDETLRQHGAVSEETVREMVEGALKVLNADYAVAVSGIAGPSGGTEEKPVGTVWIAVGNSENIVAKKAFFTRSREIIIEYTGITALSMLWRFISGKKI